jgi:LysM repeat protein
MAATNLSELAEVLSSQARGGTIGLSGDFLAPRVLKLIGASLPPLPEAIELGAAGASVELAKDQSVLWVLKATVLPGQQAPLGLGGARADVAIRQTTPGDPTGFDLILRLTLPADWTFGDSLPELWGLQPSSYLATPNGQYLYFSSFTAAQDLPAFPGEKAPADEEAALDEGLNYYADLELGGIFASVTELFDLPSPSVPLAGTIAPNQQKQPEFDLKARPQVKKLEIGFLEMGVPFIGVKTLWVDPGKDESGNQLEAMPNLLFYVGADIEIELEGGETTGVELQVVFVDKTATSFLLRLGALPGKQLSLGSLAGALLGSDAKELEASAEPLNQHLKTITLEDFSAMVTPRAPSPVQYVHAQIGTQPPWTIGSGKDAYKLDLTFSWTYFFSKPPSWTASFEAELELSPKLAFDVVVALPHLIIQGSEKGSVELELADLDAIFPLQLPKGLASLKLTDFSVGLVATEPGSKITQYSLYGIASVSIAPFGTPVLALENVEIALAIDTSKNPTQHTLNLEGTIVLGGALKLAGSATVSNVEGTDTVFTLHLVEETVGSMLNHLAHLIDPTYDITFPSPWDRFLAISLDAFVLEVNLTKETVTLAYVKEIDLEFLQLTKLAITYARGTKADPKKGTRAKASAVKVTVSGKFLGIPFGQGGSEPLAWEPINESPPSVPGKTSLLDLRYAGLGQHIGFSGKQPETIPDVLEALTNSVLPVQPGELPQFGEEPGQLSFQAGSGWLIGADLTVMGTVSIAAIFNDPNLYGVRISLAGEKAGSFAGLSFEILYRKVTDTIGVYHIELKLPTAMRTLELGAVSLTLPVVVLDIYTNGNFRVDLGFPKGLDFSNSFCLQVFPFLGYGGFYFALLDGSTSSRVPRISNGTFSPVIELGVGLQVGVGKTVNEGVLSGGLSVTVIGIVEGALAWFHPTDSSPPATYYWMHGNIAVIGRLYATIDFAIIQASVDVTATLSLSLTIEAYQPIYIEASAGVTVRVSLKIIFFTIHLSFEATIKVSFTIGSATPTPWKPIGAGPQATLAAAGRETTYATAALPVGHRATMRRQLLAANASPILDWPAVRVFPEIETASLWAINAFTKVEGGGAAAIVLLAAENSIGAAAPTVAAHREVVGTEPEKKAFNLLIAAMLGWGVHVETNPAIAPGGAVRANGTTTITTERPHGFPAGATVTLTGVEDKSFEATVKIAAVLSPTSFSCPQQGPDASSGGGRVGSEVVFAAQLEDLRQSLGLAATVEAAFGYETLSDFLAANLELDVTPPGKATAGTGVTIFPFVPALGLSAGGTKIDPEQATLAYQRNVRTYFQSLQVRFETAAEPGGDPGAAALAATTSEASMPAVVFSQYFNMLMTQGVKAAIDLLAALPFRLGSAAMSVAEIGAAIGDDQLTAEPLRIVAPNQGVEALAPGAEIELLEVSHQIRSGDTLAGIAAQLTALGANDINGRPYTAATLLAENADPVAVPGADAIFSPGVAVDYEGIAYTTQAKDSLELVATRLLVRIGGGALVNGLPRLAEAVEALLALNSPTIADPNEPIAAGTAVALPGGGSYTAVTADTLTLVAAYAVAAANHAISPTALIKALQEANQLQKTKPGDELPPGTDLKVPKLTRPMAPDDSVTSIATTLISDPEPIEASLLRAPAEPQLLSPRGVLATPTTYIVAKRDTLAGIAAKLDLTLAELAGPAAAAAGLFAAEAKLKIEDVPSIGVAALNETLLAEGEWNTAAGMVSRFLLSGLRLPDPTDTAFEKLTPEELREPEVLAGIATRPLYELSGQQFPIAASPPPGYEIELSKPAGEAKWLQLDGGDSVSYELDAKEQTLLGEIAGQRLVPEVQTATRLALLRMLPTRTALARRIVWQAAAPPPGCSPPGGAGNPALWLFPEQLSEAIGGEPRHGTLLYELALRANAIPDQATELGAYRWATLVDLAISRPELPGEAPAAANSYVVEGADDTGADLLQQLQAAVANGAKARLYLLYQPDPAGSRPSGLASDLLAADATWLLKTNLTTLTSSGDGELIAAVEADPTGVYAAKIGEADEFLALLWEASITRSGGFYLNYANADGGGGLPGSIFAGGSTARLSLLAMLEPTTPAPGAILPFHNCAVVGDNVDPTSATVVAQPVTHEVAEGESLTTVQQDFNQRWGQGLTAAGLAALNAEVPQLLALGAELAIPGQPNPYPIAYGDTLDSIATAHGVTLAALLEAGSNLTAPILATGAQVQFATGVLSPSTTVPPGTVGFELVRTDPDPENKESEALSAEQLVNSLFNLVSWSVAEGGGFLASGEGLPTTPTEAGPDWRYAQALAAAPFAAGAHGSASPALPATAANPYNGIGLGGGLGKISLPLALQDVYGNRQELPSPWNLVTVPVGYFDDVVGLSAWPSLAVSYLVEGGAGKTAEIVLPMTLQQERYVPSQSVSVDSALAAIRAALASYRGIHYQLAQPDLGFALRTTLSLDSREEPRSYPLAKAPFLAFARGAYVQLAALASLEAVELAAGGMTVAAVADLYGVSAAQLFSANSSRLYSELFGAATLQVPKTWTAIENDSLATIAARFQGLGVTELAELNAALALDPGTALLTPARTVTAATGERLADIAATARGSVPGLAAANETKAGILAPGTRLTLGTTTYEVSDKDTLASAAEKLEATVAAVAIANQYLQGLFVAGAQLLVVDVVVGRGDTLAGLAHDYDPGGLEALAQRNEAIGNVFAPATSLQVGWSSQVKAPLPSDTLLTFAQANRVTVEQLAGANPKAAFAAGSRLRIPATLEQTGAERWSTYSAPANSTLARIAEPFGVQPAEILALNPDLPGLLAVGQTVTDSASGSSVVTVAEDSFDSVIARFKAEHGVTVTPARLAADVASQPGLLLAGGLWICPPMRGDAHGENPAGSLAGLATAYGIAEPATIAIANAATLGLLEKGIPLALPGWPEKPPITTGAKETFNSLVTRLAARGVELNVAEVAAAVAGVKGLIAAQASVVAVPPPSPANAATIEPSFAHPTFQLRVEVAAERNPDWIDPDFEHAPTVLAAATTIAAEPDPGAKEKTLSLVDFAKALQAALPELWVATGDPAVEGEPSAASTVWCVNFGNEHGPALSYELSQEAATYFALPPLSRGLLAGPVSVAPYKSGSGLGELERRNFEAVDLDAWLNRFLAAVDVFLSPGYAVGAYAAAAGPVEEVVEAKQLLADAISRRVESVLVDPAAAEGTPVASRTAAIERMRQALLQKLGNASAVTTLVQLPATVSAPGTDPNAAPRLSGRLVPPGKPPPGGEADSYSFSTAKLALVEREPTATFLFSVKAPEESSHVSVDVGYAVSEIELPDPTATIGEYEGSSWLKLVLPPSPAATMRLEIPVPLRAYPSPVALLSQSATQQVAEPKKAADLIGWDLLFAYQHDDAEQDAALVEVAFDPKSDGVGAASAGGELDLEAIFTALAQFTAVEEPLADDLAKLAPQPPGATNPMTTTAVEVFAKIALAVAKAFAPKARTAVYVPPPRTFHYRLVRELSKTSPATLTRLLISAIDPESGEPRPNPEELWPKVWAKVGGKMVELRQEPGVSETEAAYEYPPGIDADTALEERFGFGFGSAREAPTMPREAGVSEANLPGIKTFSFENADVFDHQNARAGVSIWRNWSLIGGATTNPNFVYRTPIARFPGLAMPAILANEAIDLGGPRLDLAQALGEFLKQLTTDRDKNWQPVDVLQLRLSCGYGYAVAEAPTGTPELTAVVPNFLVPTVEFHPAPGTGPNPRPADWNWEASGSFVSQVAAMAKAWRQEQEPSEAGGAFVFGLTIYAGEGQLQPLIHAATLRYKLA